MITDLDLGWLAGLFDGEGSISIEKKNRKYLRLDIANNDTELLSFAQAILDELEIDSEIKLKADATTRHHASYQLTISGSSQVPRFFSKIKIKSKSKLEKFHKLEIYVTTRPYINTKNRRRRISRQYPQFNLRQEAPDLKTYLTKTA